MQHKYMTMRFPAPAITSSQNTAECDLDQAIWVYKLRDEIRLRTNSMQCITFELRAHTTPDLCFHCFSYGLISNRKGVPNEDPSPPRQPHCGVSAVTWTGRSPAPKTRRTHLQTIADGDGNLPLVDPSLVLLHKFGACLLQRNVRPQFLHGKRLARQRVRRTSLQVLNDSGALVRATVLGNDRVIHDLESDAVDEKIGHFAYLEVIRVGKGECSAEIVALLLEFCSSCLLLLGSFHATDLTRLEAGVNAVDIGLVLRLEHLLELDDKALASAYAVALADVPLCFLAPRDEGGYGGGVGRLL